MNAYIDQEIGQQLKKANQDLGMIGRRQYKNIMKDKYKNYKLE